MTERISIKEVLVDFLKQNKSSIYGYLFLSLYVPISNIYLPHLYGKIISAINEKRKIDREIRIRFACIFLLWILVQIFWGAMSIIDSKFIPKLRSHVRQYIVQKVLDTYREDYSEDELGGIIAEIVRLPDEVDHLFGNILNYILPMTFMLTFSIGYFTWTNPTLGLASIVAIGMYLCIAIHFVKKCIPTWADMNTSHRILHGEINDCLGNLLNIYTANQDEPELRRLSRYENHFIERHRRTIRCAGNFRLMLNLSYIFLFCSINVLSFYLFSRGLMKLSEVVSVLIISLELISKMSGFIGSIDRIMYELSTIKHVQEALDILSERHAKKVKPLHSYRSALYGDIIFKNLHVSYNDKPILTDINLQIPKGSTTIIIGEIGSGKTSLINALIRLVPYSGDILINGNNIKDIDLGYLREQMLYVPQNPKLFNRTIYENIAYGLAGEVSKADVLQILKKYGIKIDLDRKVGKFGQWLSGGERQIVYLLRCLFRNAPIVLLDEPTASLDWETKQYILNILNDLLIDRTVIIISHDQDVIKYADTIIELANGKIVQIHSPGKMELTDYNI